MLAPPSSAGQEDTCQPVLPHTHLMVKPSSPHQGDAIPAPPSSPGQEDNSQTVSSSSPNQECPCQPGSPTSPCQEETLSISDHPSSPSQEEEVHSQPVLPSLPEIPAETASGSRTPTRAQKYLTSGDTGQSGSLLSPSPQVNISLSAAPSSQGKEATVSMSDPPSSPSKEAIVSMPGAPSSPSKEATVSMSDPPTLSQIFAVSGYDTSSPTPVQEYTTSGNTDRPVSPPLPSPVPTVQHYDEVPFVQHCDELPTVQHHDKVPAVQHNNKVPTGPIHI